MLPALGQTGEVLLTALLVGLMFVAWWQAFKTPQEDPFYWTIGVTLIVSDLVVARSATTNYVLLLLPTIWLFAKLEQQHHWGRAVIVGYLLITVFGEWWLHTATVVGNQEQAVMFLPLPLALGAALLVMRPRCPSTPRVPAEQLAK
jgi:hypothetical protein